MILSVLEGVRQGLSYVNETSQMFKRIPCRMKENTDS